MSKSSTFENDFLKLIFQGVAIANIADNTTTAPLTNLYIALHTGDPGESGNQSTNEISYTGYTRKAVPRSALGWSVTGNIISPVSNIVFGIPTAVTGVPIATYMSIGVAVSGATKILYSGILTPSIPIIVSKPPTLLLSSTITEE
jgi:hypothetical protein